jgi:hypothetical protein
LPLVTTPPADERRHSPGPDAGWEESWYFDFVSGDGDLGGFVRLVLRPGEVRAWYWAYLVGRGRAVVAVRDHDVELPRGPALEVRSAGLWAEVTCETPLDHWSMGLEAFGVALDDPTEAWRGERGDPVALGLDMEWEATGRPGAVPGGYAQPSVVHGEVLVGSERLDVDGRGWRTHLWGVPGPSLARWWAGAHLDDGTAFCAWSAGGAWMHPPGGEPVTASARAGTDLRPDGLLGEVVLEVGDLALKGEPVAQAVVPFDGPGAGDGLVRALCSLSGGGRSGWGWYEVGASPPAG